MERRARLLTIMAVLTLVAAYLLPLLIVHESDYLALFRAAVPEADEFVKRSSEPVVYEAVSVRDGHRETVAYVGLGSGTGYEGPVLTAVVVDPTGKILDVLVVEHTEWTTWYNKVEKAGFIAGFAGRRVSDALTLGVDVDAVTGATFTSRGIADGVREAAHAIATGRLGLTPPAGERDLRLSTEAMVVAALWLVAVIGVRAGRAAVRWVTLAASLAAVGFWLAAPLTFTSIAGLLLGRVPPLDTAHLVWYVVFVGVVVTVLVFRRNIYCYWICPFGALQEILALAGGGGVSPSRRIARLLRAVRPVLVWGALLVAFLTRSPATSGYEPFGTLFTFTGSNVRWLLLILVLVMGILSRRFWCLHFCPTGYAIELLASGRRQLEKLLKKSGDRSPAVAGGHRSAGAAR